MVAVKVVKTDLARTFEIALKTLDDKVGKVGWFEGARYENDKRTPVAQVAAVHEGGYESKNIPPRPFMRPTIAKKGNEWKQEAFNKSKLIIEGKLNPYALMELIGQKAKEDISQTIINLWSPALSPNTIKARIAKYSSDPVLAESTRKKRKREVKKFVSSGLYKPLEDSGRMLATIQNTVEDE